MVSFQAAACGNPAKQAALIQAECIAAVKAISSVTAEAAASINPALIRLQMLEMLLEGLPLFKSGNQLSGNVLYGNTCKVLGS